MPCGTSLLFSNSNDLGLWTGINGPMLHLGPALLLCCVFLAIYAVARGRVGMAIGGLILLVLGFYALVNSCFALVYFSMDAQQVSSSAASTEFGRFLNDFFFSAQSLTTVGYGTLAPNGTAAREYLSF